MHTTVIPVAVRKPTMGTLVTLWLDEYFAVYKNKVESKGSKELDIYQAIGGDMPA